MSVEHFLSMGDMLSMMAFLYICYRVMRSVLLVFSFYIAVSLEHLMSGSFLGKLNTPEVPMRGYCDCVVRPLSLLCRVMVFQGYCTIIGRLVRQII